MHWVRDVVFAEDHQNACLGAATRGMALFRAAMGLIRVAGHTQIKRTMERIAADRTGSSRSWPHPDHDDHDFALALEGAPVAIPCKLINAPVPQRRLASALDTLDGS